MSLEYLLHPLLVRVYEDPEFFNKPCPDIHCLHCSFPIDSGPPIPTPVLFQDLKKGSAHPREVSFLDYDVIHVHKLYCSLHCEKASSKDMTLSSYMHSKIYDMDHGSYLNLRTALPQWTLQVFGGILRRDQFEQYSREGKIDGIADFSQIEDELEALREMELLLLPYCKFERTKFDTRNKIWFLAQPLDTKLICRNCYHTLANIKPIPCVLDYDVDLDNAKLCSGLFCTTQCRNSFIIRMKGNLRKQRIVWNSIFYSRRFDRNTQSKQIGEGQDQEKERGQEQELLYQKGQGRSIIENRSPSRRLLKKFGGFLEIDQFRSPRVEEAAFVQNEKVWLNPYQLVREPPCGPDFPFHARKSHKDFDLFLISKEIHRFYATDLMKSTKLQLNMNGDEYNLQTVRFEWKCHKVGKKSNYRIHFAALKVEQIMCTKKNSDVLQSFVNSTK